MSDILDEIRQRAAAATRGPWTWSGWALEGRAGERGVYEYDTEVIEFTHMEGTCCSPCEVGLEGSDADREFIAAARTDIEWLIAEVERLRENAARG